MAGQVPSSPQEAVNYFNNISDGSPLDSVDGSLFDNFLDVVDNSSLGLARKGLSLFLGAGKGASNAFSSSDAAGDWYEDSVLGNNSLPEYMKGLFASLGQEAVENRIYNQWEAKKARDFSAAEAEKTRNWQRMMRQTAYQDTIADMQKAGLNPILAYQQGVSSTPSGSTAQGYSASSNNAGGDTLSSLINSIANLLSSAGSLSRYLPNLLKNLR